VQDAPLVSLRQNLVLSQSHRRFLPQSAIAKSMRVCFVPFFEINLGIVVALFPSTAYPSVYGSLDQTSVEGRL